ncbi:MAG: hypothetical protein ACM30E_08190, partial [Nitrososphaerales archaeon]
QAAQPPVPPWRTAPNLPAALLESWNALSFGQSAPMWIWPALVLMLMLYALGLRVLIVRQGLDVAVSLAVATLGPLFLILVVSHVKPLYNFRDVFTYSPAFYVVLAPGLAALGRRSRPAALVTAALLLVVAGISLRAFWSDPAFRADDHRDAVHELQAHWRPGDVVLVNAGWAYTALATYWDGEIAGRYRITGALPEPRSDPSLVMVTTGHTDGAPGLGWGDLRSDFFAMPSQVAKEQVADLFDRFRRVWHYRVYDTVNDPDGLIRALLPRHGQILDERTYPGEAYLRVESYAPREGATWNDSAPGAAFGDLQLRAETAAPTATPGETLYPTISWRPVAAISTTIGTSLRLVGAGGETWTRAPDERPLGPLFTSRQWPANIVQRQPLALTVPEGTIPGDYRLVLVVYDADTGRPLDSVPLNGATAANPGLVLGRVTIAKPTETPEPRPALAEFGPLALVEATTPVTTISPGGNVPVELLWQARGALDEPLVIVVQALDDQGKVVANLEEQPLAGRYPTQSWQPGELVRDRHSLALPVDIAPGRYRVIAGVYRASDRQRLKTGNQDSYQIKEINVQ